MILRKYKKLVSSFLAFTMIFTLMFPLYGAAAAPITKSDQTISPAMQQLEALVAQQESSQEQENVLHPDLTNLTGDQEVAVIVGLSENPVALVQGINKVAGKGISKSDVASVRQKVASQQQKFKTNLASKGIKPKYGFSYDYVFNGMALKVKASDLQALASTPGVAFVEPDVEMVALEKPTPDDAVVSPMMNTSSPFLQVPEVWAKGYEGQGVKVAVLYTGIDYNHPEFEGVYKGGYNFVNQSDRTTYTRDRAENDPYETSPSERAAGKPEVNSNGSSFSTSLGTHIAGTIAAQGNNPFGIKGVAPKVELYAYRVLGAYGSGTNANVIAGINKAVEEHMDIINLSLGSASNSQTTADSIAINNAALAGTTAVVAALNSGPNRGTIGSPSTAAFAISVGNSTVPEVTRAGKVNVSLDGGAPTTYSLNMMGWKFGQDPSTVLTGTYDVVAVPNNGVDADYAGLNVQGKVALVARGGGIAFIDKIAAAKKAGAVAAIIHNFSGGTNSPGPSGVFLIDSLGLIPTFDMSTTDGQALRTVLATKKGKVTFNDFTTGTSGGDDIHSSSSRGPANPNFDIKPDVSAPGTNIMSSVPRYGKEVPNADYTEAYERVTGTNMATPHVAGVAALLKSMHPDWTPFDIKVAISNTAKQLDVTKYDVFSQGSGRVQPLNAVLTEALAYVKDTTSFGGNSYDNIKGTITFGNVITDANNEVTVTRNIDIKSLIGDAKDYTVSVQLTKNATGELAAADVTVDKSSINLAGNSTVPLKVTLTVPKGIGTSGNEILGYVKITGGNTNLNLPFAAYLSAVKSYSIDSKVISPNRDGRLDYTTVRYEFTYDQSYTVIKFWDAINPHSGYYQDGDLGSIVSETSTSTGAKTVVFDGIYNERGSGNRKVAPEGFYTFDLYTSQAKERLGPIFIKTTAPTINAAAATTNKASFNFSGTVADKYIDWKQPFNYVFKQDYDINTKLTATYQLTNAKGEAGAVTPFTLGQDGTFNLSLEGLTDGENKVKITASDDAFNSKTQEFVITKTNTPDDGATPGKGKLLLNDSPIANANITLSLHTTGAPQVWYAFITDENGGFDHNLPDGTYMIESVESSHKEYQPLNNGFTIKDGLVNGTSTLVINVEVSGLKNYSIDSHVISPNGDGNLDSTTVRFEYYNKQDATKIGLYDSYLHTLIGTILTTFPVTTGEKTVTFDASYTDYTGVQQTAPEGVYALQMYTQKTGGSGETFSTSLGPVFIKTTAPTVIAAAATTDKVTYNYSGTVADKYIDWKPLVKSEFEQEYDLNTKLTATYQLTNAKGEAGAVAPFTLSQDGTFNLALEGLTDGENKVKITVNDDAFNSKTQEFVITKTKNVDEGATPGKGTLLLNGNPMTNITFSMYTAGETKVWYDFTSDENGSFDHNLPDGTYKIDGVWSAPTWYPLNDLFTIKDGLVNGTSTLVINAENFQVPTDPSHNVLGTLTKNGEGFANIAFSIHSGDNWFDTRTDSKGKFAVAVPDGTYAIDGIWDGSLGKWYVLNQVFTVMDGKLIGGSSLSVTITALDKVTVTGKLTQGGKALANTTFSVHTASAPEVWYDATTDAKGNLSFVMPDGEYMLDGIWVEGDQTWYEMPTEFTVSGSYVLNINVPVKPANNVFGTLTNGTQALDGVVFSFHDKDKTKWYDVTTDADGKFSTLMPDGDYQLDGVWMDSEKKWYELNLQFKVENAQLVGKEKLDINLAD